MKRRLTGIGFLLWLAPCWVGAQIMDPATRELIQKMQAQIDSLEKRIVELEGAKSTPPAPRPSPAEAIHMSHDQAPSAAAAGEAAQPGYPSLKLNGFSDIDFASSNLHAPATGFGQATLLNTHSSYGEGQFALHFSSALSAKVSVFGELTLTARPDAGTNITGGPAAPGFNPELERVIVRYDLNDYFKLSFGRYHTPINYWNTAFHHGQWLQTTISRPEMTQFGGSFIPVHFVGSLLEGAMPAGGLNLNYNFGLGNGRAAVISR